MSEVISIEAPESRTYSHLEPVRLAEPVQAPPTSTYSEEVVVSFPIGGEGDATETTFGGEGGAEQEQDNGEEGADEDEDEDESDGHEQDDETVVNELLSRWTTVKLDASSST